MPYVARLRVRLQSQLVLGESGLSLSIPSVGMVTFVNGSDCYSVIAKTTCATEVEAEAAGKLLRDVLLFAGTFYHWGIDIGFDKSSTDFSDEAKRVAFKASGHVALPDVHGLTIYKDEPTLFLSARGVAYTEIALSNFELHMHEVLSIAPYANDGHRLCANLLSDASYASRVEARFVLSVSAVEALCFDRGLFQMRAEAAARFTELVDSSILSNDDQLIFTEIIEAGKRPSVRRQYMGKIRELLGPVEANNFDKLYNLRSKLLHQGQGRGELSEAAAEAFAFAARLLKEDLSSSLTNT